MMRVRLLARLRPLLTGAALLLAGGVQAGYFQWDAVEVPVSSGASCGNGTPYRFFINRTPFTSNTVIMYEGGGACWDQKSCLGEGKLSAANPDGIAADYFNQLNAAAYGWISPFTARLHPFDHIRTQAWNIVYLPYCTGDVHTGSAIRIYADSDPLHPRVQFHRGRSNVVAAARWLRSTLGQPGELLITGFSAGGAGSTATYALMRDALQPVRSSLLADSGPLYRAPRSSTPAQAPSLPLHNTVRAAWGLDQPGGLLASLVGRPGFDPSDFGSVITANALAYPADRFSYVVFQQDGNFSRFSYEKFYADILNAGSDFERRQLINQRWRQDISQWLPTLNAHANVGYHIPFWRMLNDSHCATIIDFSGTGIEESGLPSLMPVVENLIDRTGPPMRHYEHDNFTDYLRLVNPIQYLVEAFLLLFG
jgi:dienelactone hydrolase